MLLVFAGFVLVLLGYELVLALAVPPNNGDALGYHLPKAAAWAQQHAIHWIANAPTVRMNAFQPLAEQQILFLLVAAGGGALIALPQYLAQLAILVAVYGAARRLGFDVRRSTARGAAARDLLAARTRGDDGTERPRRGVVPGRRRVPAPRRRDG